MRERPRILVLTLSFGSGHVQAARSLKSEIERQDTHADVRMMDALEEAHGLFRLSYVAPYWAMIRFAPKLWERFFAARLKNKSEATAPEWAFRKGCARVFSSIADFQPDTIVACEVAAGEIATIAKRRGLTRARLVSVITDYESEPAWVKPEVETYVVPGEHVQSELCAWGAQAEHIHVCGIPIDEQFTTRQNAVNVSETRIRLGIEDDAPLVLLMGGGMGPTRMDTVAAKLIASATPMHVVAIAGHDRRAHHRLTKLAQSEATRRFTRQFANDEREQANVSLRVFGWTERIAELMHAAQVLVTKPGGVTTAEAAACELPVVMFDAIPGPELRNAQRFVEAGAGVSTRGADETANAVLTLLGDENLRWHMARNSARLARPDAAYEIARLTINRTANAANKSAPSKQTAAPCPVMILTIANGAGHTRAAQAIADAVRVTDASAEAVVVDVADYMNRVTWFTHVAAYLWLVKHAPRIWERIDFYQKRQPHTSPEWYYRRGCRRLFEYVRYMQPCALVATEVGCCEIAALIKRDLNLDVPLVAVNLDHEADCAWIQREVDAYSVTTNEVRAELIGRGAQAEKVFAWGAPLASDFVMPSDEKFDAANRANVCHWLMLDARLPIVLIAGGGEGLGNIEQTVVRLLGAKNLDAQLIVLAGHNERLRKRLERRSAQLAREGQPTRLRVLGWTKGVPDLMRAADCMVGKLGATFSEAMSVGLPLVALPPPPGSEQVQSKLLDEWGVGCAVRTLDEMAEAVTRLLRDDAVSTSVRERARIFNRPDAATHIARWITAQVERQTSIADNADDVRDERVAEIFHEEIHA